MIESFEIIQGVLSGNETDSLQLSAGAGPDCIDRALKECGVDEPGYAVRTDEEAFENYLAYLEQDVSAAINAAQNVRDSLDGLPHPAPYLQGSFDRLIERLENLQSDISAAKQSGSANGSDMQTIAEDLYSRAFSYQSYGIQNLADLSRNAGELLKKFQ